MNDFNEAPQWAKDLIDRIDKMMDSKLPEEKKPDFSEFRERLKFRGLIPEDK